MKNKVSEQDNVISFGMIQAQPERIKRKKQSHTLSLVGSPFSLKRGMIASFHNSCKSWNIKYYGHENSLNKYRTSNKNTYNLLNASKSHFYGVAFVILVSEVNSGQGVKNTKPTIIKADQEESDKWN